MASIDFEKEKQVFRNYHSENLELFEAAKNAFIVIINSILAEDIPISSVTGRVKDKEECIKKFSRKYQTELEEVRTPYEIKDHITDLIGLRVVSLYESDIVRIRDILSEEFEFVEITDKIEAMESKEDSFGYKGLHVDLKLKEPRSAMREYARYNDLRFELQIRTIIQDAWSALDHKIKYKKSIPIDLKRRINTLAALFELADREFYSILEETIRSEEKEKRNRDHLSEKEQLNAFSFLVVAEEKFPDYRFQPHKVDGFVLELVDYGNLSPSRFKTIVEEGYQVVDDYKQYLGQNDTQRHALNPYMVIRHLLYMHDNTKYRRILYNDQRDRFDRWLEKNGKEQGSKK